MEFIPLTVKLIFKRYYNNDMFDPIYYLSTDEDYPSHKIEDIFIPTGELLEIDIVNGKQTVHHNWLQNYKSGPYKSLKKDIYYYLVGFVKHSYDEEFKYNYIQICSRPLNRLSENCINWSCWVEKNPQNKDNIAKKSLKNAFMDYNLIKKYKSKINFTRLTLDLALSYQGKIIHAYRKDIIGIDPTSDFGPDVEPKHLNNRKKIFDNRVKIFNKIVEQKHGVKKYIEWKGKKPTKNIWYYIEGELFDDPDAIHYDPVKKMYIGEKSWRKFYFPIFYIDREFYVYNFWVSKNETLKKDSN